MKTSIQINLTFEQILSAVRQLPKQQKMRLTKELERDAIDAKLTRLLDTFKSDELDLNLIEEEVENVRQKISDKKKR